MGQIGLQKTSCACGGSITAVDTEHGREGCTVRPGDHRLAAVGVRTRALCVEQLRELHKWMEDTLAQPRDSMVVFPGSLGAAMRAVEGLIEAEELRDAARSAEGQEGPFGAMEDDANGGGMEPCGPF